MATILAAVVVQQARKLPKNAKLAGQLGRTCVRCLNSKPIWRAASTSAISSGDGPCNRTGRVEGVKVH